MTDAQTQTDPELKQWEADQEKYPNKSYYFEYVTEIDSEGKDITIECEVKKMPCGTWNGYVTLPEGHRLIGKGYDELPYYIYPHGGVTYARKNKFGFDTMHIGTDIIPTWSNRQFPSVLSSIGFSEQKRKYWTFEMVKAETIKLARQFALMEKFPENELDETE
jgi:hypothetical protein